MNDDLPDKPPAFNRVSIRAVLVREGEDPTEALAQAGFADVISIPVILGDQPGLSGGILGDGITPNLVAVLETEQDESLDAGPDQHPAAAQPASEQASPAGPASANLPPAFGMQPLAPVGRLR